MDNEKLSIMKTHNKKMFWQCHTENLFKEIINSNPTANAVARPLDIMGKILFVLADRARELDDPELNSLCCRLTLFAQADKQSPDFDNRAIDLIHEFDDKFIKRLSKKS